MKLKNLRKNKLFHLLILETPVKILNKIFHNYLIILINQLIVHKLKVEELLQDLKRLYPPKVQNNNQKIQLQHLVHKQIDKKAHLVMLNLHLDWSNCLNYQIMILRLHQLN